MSKVIPIALASHYEARQQSTAIVVKITRRDGEVFGCTSHDVDIPYDGITFVSGLPAVESAQMQISSTFSTDNTELSGLVSDDGLSTADIEAGDWDGATVEVWRLNWRAPDDGHEIIGTGELGQFSHDGLSYRVEFKSLKDHLQKKVTRALIPLCDATFGDARCKLDAATFTFSGTVTAVVDNANFTDSGLAQAAEYFDHGRVDWLAGANAGRSMEVKAHATGGVIELEIAMQRDIEVGDTFEIVAGDDHRLETCRDKFSNIVNYRGFNYMPGNDALVQRGSR